nr:RNA-directed DNA polymerase, eukaryota [Tanacetum cinerariifolium]
MRGHDIRRICLSLRWNWQAISGMGPEVSRGSFNSTNNKAAGDKGYAKTFVNVVKDNSMENGLSSAIVLDDDCLNTKELNTSLLGRVKEFALFLISKRCYEWGHGFRHCDKRLMNLFLRVELLGWKWKGFRSNFGRKIQLIRLQQSGEDYWTWMIRMRVIFILKDYAYVHNYARTFLRALKLCSGAKFIGFVLRRFQVGFRSFWMNQRKMFFSNEGISNKMNDGGEVPDIDEVPETDFEETNGLKVGQSDDPFGIYSLLNKKKSAAPKDGNDEDQSPKFPPGFTPDMISQEAKKNGDQAKSVNGDNLNDKSNDVQVEHDGNSIGQVSKIANSDSIGPGRFKKSVTPCNGGSILSLMEEVVRKAKKDWVKELCIKNKVNSMGLQETKIESIDLFSVKRCWGNLAFEYVHSDSIGGSMYTWCHKSATKMSKLDRFFISENLLNTCPNINAITLERYLSDHRPILLRESSCDYGPVPFRIFHYWIEVNGFDKLVMNSWYDAPSHGNNAILSFMSKLKFLKTRIKEWNVDYRRSSNGVADKLKEELLEIDAEIDNGNGNADIVVRRLVIINELQCISKSQVAKIAQKIKIRWCVEGDENSKFFHGILNKKRSQSNIRGVLIDGKWTDELVKFKCEFFHHFSNRFGKPSDDRVEIDMNFPNTLSIDQKADLESMVTIEEVKRAVWDCGRDKAPGPDGYTFSFYRHFWSTIEKDLFAAVQYFFNHGDIPKGCNSTLITLIPKIPGANMVKDFRPISLIGSFYKIIAKVLTNRLVGMLGDIVNEVQSVFIANRKILDGPFIVNEAIQWCKKKKKQALIIKVDFEKALCVEVFSSGFGIEDQHVKKQDHRHPCTKVGDNMSRVEAWKDIVEKVSSRLSRWKLKMLSIGVIKAIHGVDKGLGRRPTTGARSCWSSIVQEMKNLRIQGGVEEDQYTALSDMMDSIILTPKEDSFVWSLENSGDFSVKSIRKRFNDTRFIGGEIGTRWIKSVPIKVNIMAWKIQSDALPTRFNISRWSFRNKLLFDTKAPLKSDIFDNVMSSSFNWCRYRCKASFSCDDWLKTPYLV